MLSYYNTSRAHRVISNSRSKADERAHYKLVRDKLKELKKKDICFCFNQEQAQDIINGYNGSVSVKEIDGYIYISKLEN